MKLRYPVVCERCKVAMLPPDRGIRVHGRIWHYSCATRYAKARQARRMAHSS